jgi:hypothetical protein
MRGINHRRAYAAVIALATAALLFVQLAILPTRAHAAGTDTTPCLWRVGILQVGCLLSARTVSSQAAARVAAARQCQQTMNARIQVCRIRSAGQTSGVPPTSGALSGPPDSTTPTVTTDKFEYRPGDVVAISGSGWETLEHVALVLHVDPPAHPDIQLSVVADEDGNFHASYRLQASDAGATFSLTAVGHASGQAQTAGLVDPLAAAH